MDRAELIQHLRREGVTDERVLSTMQKVRRELFVPSQSEHLAYADRPLPIGEGQTISQPFIVALMTQALRLTPEMKVLEIGTGSGYQTAILAHLSAYVVSLDRRKLLADRARLRLSALSYVNVEVHHADGALGWPPEAPYDAIIVTAGSPRVPEKLVEQMANHGRLVIPVGSLRFQSLRLVEKQNGQVQISDLGACRFVPLVGEGAWQEDIDDTEYWGV
ncbi:MAG: protein-L-isoaspartate(D-aspartate) O-methyltransferase [Chloroflexi bacterium]|nr:protein-L-isoaspartate(D-aspartate) O-methyltransferase [Chloroflexota bacterium]MDA8188602.1 protein-L-isoaspartate(D-aspartate) O-methyltransferase [Dehalococcoidales bacterium]